MIFINTEKQKLYLLANHKIKHEFTISSSLKGTGCQVDSNKTPIGLHAVISKIGSGLPAGTLFKNRRPTKRIINYLPTDKYDYITSRIIRLSGLTVKDKRNLKGDITIKITGLKKGEKLYEEVSLGKNLIKTPHPKIMKCDEKMNHKNFFKKIKKIEDLLNKKRFKKNILKDIV